MLITVVFNSFLVPSLLRWYVYTHKIDITRCWCKEKRYTLQHTATHCNTLQHTATHCNTLLISRDVYTNGSRTLLIEHRALLIEYRALLTDYRALLIAYWQHACPRASPCSSSIALECVYTPNWYTKCVHKWV